MKQRKISSADLPFCKNTFKKHYQEVNCHFRTCRLCLEVEHSSTSPIKSVRSNISAPEMLLLFIYEEFMLGSSGQKMEAEWLSICIHL